MALAIQGSLQQGFVSMGQNGRKLQWGTFKFSTTDANGELSVNMHYVESVLLTPVGVPATDEQAYVDEAFSDGGLVVPSTGTITVARTGAAKTSNLIYSYLAIGR
jgi:hypothetical protein